MSPTQERVRVQRKERKSKRTDRRCGWTKHGQTADREMRSGWATGSLRWLSVQNSDTFTLQDLLQTFRLTLKSISPLHTQTQTHVQTPKLLLPVLHHFKYFEDNYSEFDKLSERQGHRAFGFFSFLNGGPVYQVSWAVIYKATGRRSGVQGRGYFTGLKQTSNKGQ